MEIIFTILFFVVAAGWFVYCRFFTPKNKEGVSEKTKSIIRYIPEEGTLSFDEKDMLNQINYYRDSKGLSKLKPDKLTKQLSDEHLNYMINNRRCTHDNFKIRLDELKHRGALLVHENVAYGMTKTSFVMYAYIHSDGHRHNLELSEITHVGISTKWVDGVIWNVQLFVRFPKQ